MLMTLMIFKHFFITFIDHFGVSAAVLRISGDVNLSLL